MGIPLGGWANCEENESLLKFCLSKIYKCEKVDENFDLWQENVHENADKKSCDRGRTYLVDCSCLDEIISFWNYKSID